MKFSDWQTKQVEQRRKQIVEQSVARGVSREQAERAAKLFSEADSRDVERVYEGKRMRKIRVG